MKLFVWNNPYSVDYGGSCLYVIAKDVEQARELAKSKCADGNYVGLDRKNMRETCVPVDGVEPTSVHDLPYAECYNWQE